MEMDFESLNEAINSAHKCRVVNCANRVCDPYTFCMGCFVGLMTGEVVDDPETGEYHNSTKPTE